MIMLVDLPDIIYILFKSFLSDEDFVQLVSSSQRYFKEIRRENLYFLLDNSKSERFCVDASYRDYVLSKVAHPDQQISVALSIDFVQRYKDLLTVHRLHVKDKEGQIDVTIPVLPAKGISLVSLSQIQPINSLSQFENVYIFSCNGITDISALKDVKDVKIFHCNNIRDFSCLGRRKGIRLHECPTLTNVKNFTGIQTLEINYCEGLFDVRPLHGIPFLSLICCVKVKEISGLGNHRRLRIYQCAYALIGYQILETVRDIALDSCDITDVSMMKKARSVNLSNLQNLKDVSSLANVKEVTLFNCKEVEDISMLDKVRALHLGPLPAIKKYDGIEHHPNLTITYIQALNMMKSEEKRNDLTNLTSAVRNLYLCNIKFSAIVFILPSLSHLMLLSFFSHDEDFELQGCEDIHTVQLISCLKIKSTKGLGRNREVLILGCDEMNDVSYLANVPIVTISYCSKLIDVSCLANVPRLKVSSCGVKEVV